jgi:glycerol uptake facilitator protein
MKEFIAEAVGTALLVMFGNGVVANQLLGKTKGNDTGWMLISTGWGLAVAIAAYSVARYSGAHLNPAVTFGLLAIKQLDPQLLPAYLSGQMLGAIIGAVLCWLVYLPHWRETANLDHKLAVFCTAPAIRSPLNNLICELIATAALVFGILCIAGNASAMKEGQMEFAKIFSSGIQPLLVGFLVWLIGMALGGPTGYAINPARDLGPRIAHFLLPMPGGSDWQYAWIPVVGPSLGGVIGAVLFQWLDRVAA